MSAQKRSVTGVVGGVLGFLGMSVVAGLLVSAAVTPALALTGMAANNTIGVFDNLPGYLAIQPLAQKSSIYAKNAEGKDVFLASFYFQNREEVPWTGVSQVTKDAVVAGEDRRFYQHGGVDLRGTARAIVATVTGGDLQGGSTITQQYVKNVLVQKAEAIQNEAERAKEYKIATETTPERKLKEMKLAIELEKTATKDQILLGYLNIAGFGGTVYGIEAAAKYYYNVRAKDLNIQEAASLVAIVNEPSALKLDDPESTTNGEANGYAANKVRRDSIIGDMLEEKKITQKQHDDAIAAPIEPKITPTSTGCQSAGGAAYFCDYVTHDVEHLDAFGATEDERWMNFRRGGYKIYTTLDVAMQKAAEEATTGNVPPTSSWGNMGSASVAVAPGSGEILAMAQSKKYSQDPDVLKNPDYTAINYNADYNYGGSNGFQAASTYKVFTLAAWLEAGHPLQENFDGRARPINFFHNSCDGDWSGEFYPKNDDGTGANNAISATKYSVNSAFMAMAEKLDLCKIKQTAQAFGIHRANLKPLGWTEDHPDVPKEGVMYPSDVLGTQEVAPLTMATAFAAIANNGVKCTPVSIKKIIAANGDELEAPKTTCSEAVPPKVAAAMAYAMQETFNGGTASASNTYTGVPHIGKTGTNDDNIQTWMIGASTKVALATWVGNITGFANQRDNSFDRTTGEAWNDSAATARHRIWQPIMLVADHEYGGDAFPDVENKLLYGEQVNVPDVRGKSLDEAESLLRNLGFNLYSSREVDSELPKGQVVGSDPGGGATVIKGAFITVLTSNGVLKVVPDVTNYSLGDAQGALGGFNVKVKTEKVKDKQLDGLVLRTDPAAGSGAKAGQTITVYVGKHEAPKPKKNG